MSKLNPDNIFDQFSENIPNAHEHAETYLRAIGQYARDGGLPVAADVAEERLEGGLRGKKTLCVVLTPTERRLRRYPSYHYGRSVGTTLNVGWYLVGKIASAGLAEWGPLTGGSTQMDMDNLEALMHAVHGTAVVPAMHAVAATAGFGVGSNRPRQGFFGA